MYIHMRFLFFSLASMAVLVIGAARSDSGPKGSSATPTQYYIDVVAVAMDDCKLENAYVVELLPGAIRPINDWFHCGPLTAKQSEFKKGNSFLGQIDKNTKNEASSTTPTIKDMDYEGKLSYRVTTDGFPMELDAEFSLKDLRKPATIIAITGHVAFKEEDSTVVMRSAKGEHLLILRLRRK